MRIQFSTFIIIAFTLLFSAIITAQNLVTNPSFELYTSCPNGFGNSGVMDCEPWFNANTATADYYNVCSTNWLSTVPTSYQGLQVPHSGVAYAGILCKSGPPPVYWFEYPEAPLTTVLLAGHAYHVSFYACLAYKYCAIMHLGAYLSVGPVNEPTPGYLPFTPQVESNFGWLNDTTNWTLIEGCFVAHGGEDHIMIGNFHSWPNTPIENCVADIPGGSYYFIDDVSVEETPLMGFDVDLGDDISACYEYTIIPEVMGNTGNVHYLWSNGSTAAELTVTTSGEYKVTIYDDECRGGKDSIEVTITNQPPVAFNPQDTLICAGESLVISLNPLAGDYEWSDGSTSAQYAITTEGHYSVTLDDGCDISEDEIDVDVLDPPADFSLGSDTILCLGTEIEFNFDPSLGDFTWQDGSQSNSIIIFQQGEYALTISNMCGEASAMVSVDELAPINVNLGPAQDILCNNETLDIFLDDTYATYQWQDGSSASTYHISTAGVYTVTMTYVCNTSIDSILILQLPIPYVDLGDTIFACPGDTIFLTSTSNVGNYTWQDGSANDSIQVTSPGSYTLTIENQCGSDHDSVLVQFEDLLLPVNLGPDVSLCPGEQLILYAGDEGASHLWQDGSTADSLVLNGPGDYHVTVSNSCFTFSDTIHVDIGNTPPSINLPSQIVLCEGSTSILDPGVAGVNYLWNDGTTGSTLAISGPGAYSVTVDNTCGTDIDTIVVMDGGPLPSVELGANMSLCPGDTIDVQPVLLHVDTWAWQDGSVSASFSVIDSGFVHITVMNSCGVSSDSLFISLLEAAPVLDLGADTSLCDGQSITLSIATGNADILWSDGSTGDSFTLQNPGIYSAILSNTCGADKDTVILSQLSSIPILDLGPDLPLCPGETITITPGIEDVDYSWQDGSTDSSFVIHAAQTIMLNISNACGIARDTLNIFTSTDGPDVDLGTDILACEGETVMINSNISGVNYLWQDGSTGSSFLADATGLYSVTVSNSCGMDMDTVEVDIHGMAPDPDLGADTLICEGNMLTLVSNADAETTTTWQDGSDLSVYVVNSPGTYTLHQQNRCGEKLDSISVAYQSLPVQVDLGPDTTLCPGESVLLMGPVTQDTYQWQNGSQGQTFLAEQEGMYTLSIRNMCGTNGDSVIVNFDDRIPQFPSGDTFKLCQGDSLTLDVVQTFPVTYSWNTNSTLPVITVITPGVYSVSIITDCVEMSHDFTVDIKLDCAATNKIFIPNIFSPNDDEINDVFGLFPNQQMDIISIDGSIFDRWGNLIFHSDGIPFIWNGRFSDEIMIPGVYVYIFVVQYKVNTQVIQERFTGDVTLVK